MPLDEKVLVIPTERFRSAGYFNGFRRSDPTYRTAILDYNAFQFRPRSEVETDSEFKQLIPYIVLKHGGELFHYRRGSAGTEKRLQALRSVGIGGHISEDDARGGDDPYHTGMLRELFEEVEIGCEWTEQFLGFINDDNVPVGRVHLGVVHLFELSQARVNSKEAALADSGFGPIQTLLDQKEQFETWSQFVLGELQSVVPLK
ncbi:MAG TPA: phosphoesterase [Gemmata sp.]|jgi:predicted NUDIX family phosphoesterase|nr:phosphoesterase [Gemmata sp.]